MAAQAGDLLSKAQMGQSVACRAHQLKLGFIHFLLMVMRLGEKLFLPMALAISLIMLGTVLEVYLLFHTVWVIAPTLEFLS